MDYQRKGDPPSHVTSGLMKLTLARQSPSDIDNATLDGGEVIFQFPRNVTKDRLKQFDTVNTKVSLDLSILLFSYDIKFDNSDELRKNAVIDNTG